MSNSLSATTVTPGRKKRILKPVSNDEDDEPYIPPKPIIQTPKKRIVLEEEEEEDHDNDDILKPVLPQNSTNKNKKLGEKDKVKAPPPKSGKKTSKPLIIESEEEEEEDKPSPPLVNKSSRKTKKINIPISDEEEEEEDIEVIKSTKKSNSSTVKKKKNKSTSKKEEVHILSTPAGKDKLNKLNSESFEQLIERIDIIATKRNWNWELINKKIKTVPPPTIDSLKNKPKKKQIITKTTTTANNSEESKKSFASSSESNKTNLFTEEREKEQVDKIVFKTKDTDDNGNDDDDDDEVIIVNKKSKPKRTRSGKNIIKNSDEDDQETPVKPSKELILKPITKNEQTTIIPPQQQAPSNLTKKEEDLDNKPKKRLSSQLKVLKRLSVGHKSVLDFLSNETLSGTPEKKENLNSIQEDEEQVEDDDIDQQVEPMKITPYKSTNEIQSIENFITPIKPIESNNNNRYQDDDDDEDIELIILNSSRKKKPMNNKYFVNYEEEDELENQDNELVQQLNKSLNINENENDNNEKMNLNTPQKDSPFKKNISELLSSTTPKKKPEDEIIDKLSNISIVQEDDIKSLESGNNEELDEEDNESDGESDDDDDEINDIIFNNPNPQTPTTPSSKEIQLLEVNERKLLEEENQRDSDEEVEEIQKTPQKSTDPNPDTIILDTLEISSNTTNILPKLSNNQILPPSKQPLPYFPFDKKDEKFNQSMVVSPFDINISNNLPTSTATTSQTTFEAEKKLHASSYFKRYNAAIFNGRLPDNLYEWSETMVETTGKTKISRTKDGRNIAKITLSFNTIRNIKTLTNVICHEMCHAAVWLFDSSIKSHGNEFQYWCRLALRAFPELSIDVCDNYKTAFPHNYKCQSLNCDVRFGRTLPLEESIHCGKCGSPIVPIEKVGIDSKFELFYEEQYPILTKKHPNLDLRAIKSIIELKWKNFQIEEQKQKKISTMTKQPINTSNNLISSNSSSTTLKSSVIQPSSTSTIQSNSTTTSKGIKLIDIPTNLTGTVKSTKTTTTSTSTSTSTKPATSTSTKTTTTSTSTKPTTTSSTSKPSTTTTSIKPTTTTVKKISPTTTTKLPNQSNQKSQASSKPTKPTSKK